MSFLFQKNGKCKKTEKKTDKKGAAVHYTEIIVLIIWRNRMNCLEIIRELKRRCEICKPVLDFIKT